MKEGESDFQFSQNFRLSGHVATSLKCFLFNGGRAMFIQHFMEFHFLLCRLIFFKKKLFIEHYAICWCFHSGENVSHYSTLKTPLGSGNFQTALQPL